MRSLTAMAVLFLCVSTMVAQDKGKDSFQLRREDGGTVSLRTLDGWINQDSSLKRNWYVIDDLAAPALLDRAGVFPRLEEKEGTHYLVPIGVVSPKQAISAVEVRYMLFDIWGDHIRTLSVTRMVDSATHIDFRERDRFPAPEYEASRMFTVVAFISRVRTSDGHVWSFNREQLLPQIEALDLTLVPDDLIPDEQRGINPSLIYWTYSPPRKEAAIKRAEPSRR